MSTVVIVSGYFNPIHLGHIRMLEAASQLDKKVKVIVVVNNDRQQLLKKGKIIMGEEERLEVVRAIRFVSEAQIAIDEDPTIMKTLAKIARAHDESRIIFANGGDRSSAANVPETTVCERYGIEMQFAIGGADKLNSSSNINQLRGEESES